MGCLARWPRRLRTRKIGRETRVSGLTVVGRVGGITVFRVRLSTLQHEKRLNCRNRYYFARTINIRTRVYMCVCTYRTLRCTE